MLGAVEIARRERPELVPVVSCAPGMDKAALEARLAKREPAARVSTQTYDVLRGCSVGLVKSGTATLEAALLGLPMVVTYAASRLAALQWHLFAAKNVKFIAMPNIIADEEIVPELYGRHGKPEDLAREVLRICGDPGRREAMLQAYDAVREQLAPEGAGRAVADMIEEMLTPG